MKERLTYLAFSLGWTFLKFIPEGFGRSLLGLVAKKIYTANKKSVQQLRANLKQVTGAKGEALEDIVNQGVISYLKYWYEAFVITNWTKQKINKTFIMTNEEVLNKYLSQEKYIVLALSHLGNWDAAGAWFTTNHRPLTAVAEKLKPVKLYEKFIKFRAALGIEVLPLERGSDTFNQLLDRIKSGRVIALLADRDISQSGIKVKFFNLETSMPPGPAALAWATDGVVVPIEIYNGPKNQIFAKTGEALRIDKSLPKEEAIKELTQKLASRFEAMISDHPTDWHVMQRVWHEVKPSEAG